MKTAFATIKGFEIMRMFKKGQLKIWMHGARNEVSFINEQFGIMANLRLKFIIRWLLIYLQRSPNSYRVIDF